MKKLSECKVGFLTVEIDGEVAAVSAEVDGEVVVLLEQEGECHAFSEDYEITFRQQGVILTAVKLLMSVSK